ncbi:glycoside hydrolase family 95 protein [Flavobacterium algicola]|uniref:glycoside hydrolase family 95 protein n=1 Tax=Flavobacterium algicola TaxID=556529 RepID=UPI001EFCA2F9|nr:glycoside hydrolase family 95 protein [Flavobacterium algicola]MCG9792846.1 glycoside hydrolase family 95 protein [Flavobacterium algicola]
MKKKLQTTMVTLLLFIALSSMAQENKDLKLWYNAAAADWNEALPIGNGRLGAMVFGIPEQENIQLNENTLWAGSPHRNDNPDGKEALSEIRKLLFDQKYSEAHRLAENAFISKTSHGMPYETVGNLRLNFNGHKNVSNYYRELDIEKAVNTTSYTVDGVNYKREIFTSFSDQVIVMKLSASKDGKISFSAAMDRPAPAKVVITFENNNVLKMTGFGSDNISNRIKNGSPIPGKVEFESRLKIVQDGGTIKTNDKKLIVANANSVTMYISIATNFINYKDISGDPHQKAANYIAQAEKKSYKQLLEDHTNLYQKYFKRVSLKLGKLATPNKTTDSRIKDFSTTNDPALAALYFQFGRYLLISASQPGGQPANLQGLWCNELTPPWKSAYTVNINTQMNYWPAEVTNLSEMHDPLIQMVQDLSMTGKETAAVMYGAKGWVTHHNTDIWRITGPVDGATWGMWPTGGTWLSQHLWEKFMFNGDLKYLKEVYPAMKGASEFCLSTLTEDPKSKWLIISPSLSPEHAPQGRPKLVNIESGTTMDNQLVYDILTKTISAAKLLRVDPDLIQKMELTLSKLPPMQIGQYGQLQEWMQDWDDPKDTHRHVSHLYGLYPSNQISPYKNPQLFQAAKNTLIQRGDPSTGWSMNWKINLWARLLDGNHAYKLMGDQIKLVGRPDSPNGGGTYANMLDAHPPFQIDGNFGFTSGLTEMLIQSYDGAIQLIPALPDVWKDGNVTGLRARGGFELSELLWADGAVEKVVLKSTIGGICRIRSYTELVFENKKNIKLATGVNSNEFYQTPIIKKALVNQKSNLETLDLKPTYLYDIPTVAGQKVVLVKK